MEADVEEVDLSFLVLRLREEGFGFGRLIRTDVGINVGFTTTEPAAALVSLSSLDCSGVVVTVVVTAVAVVVVDGDGPTDEFKVLIMSSVEDANEEGAVVKTLDVVVEGTEVDGGGCVNEV